MTFWEKTLLTVRRKVYRTFFALSGSNSVVECNLAKVEVAGSNPVSRSILCRNALRGMALRFTEAPLVGGNNSTVECQLPKLKVAGSNPVSRSILMPRSRE